MNIVTIPVDRRGRLHRPGTRTGRDETGYAHGPWRNRVLRRYLAESSDYLAYFERNVGRCRRYGSSSGVSRARIETVIQLSSFRYRAVLWISCFQRRLFGERYGFLPEPGYLPRHGWTGPIHNILYRM